MITKLIYYAILYEMQAKQFKLKSDRYRKTRGGNSRFLNIYCNKCKSHVFLYQKDGPGPLKRAYLDRILAPEDLSKYQTVTEIKEVPALVCSNCRSLIGKPYIYDKEGRKAFLLDPTSFAKKIGKGIYPPELPEL